MFIEINGIKVNYTESGGGETLLLLHGWGCNESVYRGVTQNLAKRFRVILPELPGFGKSGEPSTAWGVSDYAEFVLDFCGVLGLKPNAVFAHSLGCRIAIKLLAQNRLTPSKVIFTGAAGIKPKRTAAQKLRTQVFKAKKLFLKPFPEALEKMRKKYGSADYRDASPIMRSTLVKIVNEDLTELLSQINRDILLIWGENDDSTPLADGKTMEQLLQNAGLAVIKNAGHYAFLEQPELFMKILDSYTSQA
ncbi:MAG: alpha/beta hydrolase [Oscillospiraceae bacterium]|nr:alpha/beta hydrolase [Oscillospiraceae bacterium]